MQWTSGSQPCEHMAAASGNAPPRVWRRPMPNEKLGWRFWDDRTLREWPSAPEGADSLSLGSTNLPAFTCRRTASRGRQGIRPEDGHRGVIRVDDLDVGRRQLIDLVIEASPRLGRISLGGGDDKNTIAPRSQISVGSRPDTTIDVAMPVDGDRRPYTRNGTARSNGVDEIDARTFRKHRWLSGHSIHRGQEDGAIWPAFLGQPRGDDGRRAASLTVGVSSAREPMRRRISSTPLAPVAAATKRAMSSSRFRSTSSSLECSLSWAA